MAKNEVDIFKKGHQNDVFTQERLEELRRCQHDVIYFIEKYIKIQHPKKGRVPFRLYPFQREMIENFATYNRNIALTGRQQGKSMSTKTMITKNNTKVKIGELFCLNLREKIVDWLETALIYFAIKKGA